MSGQQCENYMVRQEIGHWYSQNVDRCCMAFVDYLFLTSLTPLCNVRLNRCVFHPQIPKNAHLKKSEMNNEYCCWENSDALPSRLCHCRLNINLPQIMFSFEMLMDIFKWETQLCTLQIKGAFLGNGKESDPRRVGRHVGRHTIDVSANASLVCRPTHY